MSERMVGWMKQWKNEKCCSYLVNGDNETDDDNVDNDNIPTLKFWINQ